MLKIILCVFTLSLLGCVSTLEEVRLDDNNALVLQERRFLDFGVFGSFLGSAKIFHCTLKPEQICERLYPSEVAYHRVRLAKEEEQRKEEDKKKK